MAHSSETPHYFEAISKMHDLSTFQCEDSWLTSYLKTEAVDEAAKNHSRTFLCLDKTTSPENIIGFFTLRASNLQVRGGPIIPVAELVALARHIDRRGEEWGNVLLSEALAKVLQAGRLIGLAGVRLDTTQQGRRLYEEMGFFDFPINNNSQMYLPLNKIPELE